MRALMPCITYLLTLCLFWVGHAVAGSSPPLVVVHIDPVFGPICAGPLGPGPCDDVRRFIKVQQFAATINLPVVGMDPYFGPICNGPLGNAPCQQIAWFLAVRQVAAQEFQLQQVGNVCMGPFGPAPCEALRDYLMQAQLGVDPYQQVNPRAVQVVGTPWDQNGGPLCQGPFGQIPCTLAGQSSLDRMGVLPAPGSFVLPAGGSAPAKIAAACARQVKVDVAAFAICTGQKIVLPANQQALLDCAVKSNDTQSFAYCAAPKLGIKISADQRKLVGCAMGANGSEEQVKACVGSALVDRALNSDEKAILNCASNANSDPAKFATCASTRVFSLEQKAVVDCAVESADAAAFANCAAPNVGIKMSDEQRILARCAMQSRGDTDDLAACAGSAFVGNSLGPNEQAVLNCAASSAGDTSKFASCSANKLLGGKLSREQQVAIQCAAQAQGDISLAATCAGANMFKMQLNPEQQIAVQCIVSSGGQPYAAAGCMASRLTVRELTKCLADGVGGDGCFGDSNDLVGRNGWVARNMGQIAGGSGSVINNPDQIWGGDNSFVRHPHQILGGSNSFARNPGQFWGGNNSIFNNPGQLLPKPRPLQVGSVAGKRICLPWC